MKKSALILALLILTSFHYTQADEVKAKCSGHEGGEYSDYISVFELVKKDVKNYVFKKSGTEKEIPLQKKEADEEFGEEWVGFTEEAKSKISFLISPDSSILYSIGNTNVSDLKPCGK